MAPTATGHITVSYPLPHVAHVELARKPVNAFNEAFWLEYGSTIDSLGKNGDIRAVVVSSGLDKLFTAGLDIKDAVTKVVPSASDPARAALVLHEDILAFQHAIGAPERCPVPVIVALHGLALGLAIDLSLACDVRYAASDVQLSIKEVDVGLAADIGTLARAPKALSSSSLLHELAYSARTFGAADALRLGFVSRVVEGGREGVVRAALALAGEIAGKSPVAVMGTKKLLLHARDHTVAQNLEYTAVWNSAMVQASDTSVAMNSFMTKKPPTYEPLRKPKAKL